MSRVTLPGISGLKACVQYGAIRADMPGKAITDVL